MHKRSKWVGFVVLVACALAGTAALADRITLKDGTVLEGLALKEKGGYWFKGADGERRHIADDDIVKVEKGSGGSTGSSPAIGGSAHKFVGSLSSTKQRAESVDTPVAAVSIWQQYIDSHPAAADLKVAQEEMAKWKKLQEGGAEKIKGRWVGGQERKDIVEKAKALTLEGLQLMKEDKTLPAVKKLEEAQAIYPNSFPSNFWLGYLCMLQHNQWDKAIGYFNQALRLRPNSPEVLANIGVCQFYKKQYQDAVLTLYKAAQNGDNEEIAQDLLYAVSLLPPAQQKSEKFKGAMDAASLLASKYSTNGQGFVLVRLHEEEEKKQHHGEGGEEHIPGTYYSGTGFILTSDGLVLTNRHVVDGAKTLMVYLDGKVQKSGEVVKIDDEQDLALIRIKVDPGQKLPVVQLSPGDNPADGAECTVMGFPLLDRLGSNIKITRGVVTDSKTEMAMGPDVMIDAKVNPGNSGGPILDKYGNVMAIVSMKTLSTTSEDTYGLGISAGHIRKFLAKNNVDVPKGKKGATPLSTEDIAAKVKPAAVCILITR